MAAAAVVSVSMGVMKAVLAKLASLTGDEYKKLKGLRKEVTFLQQELGDMDALLEKMDSTDELDPQAKKWRKDIIEMSYNIEDRIDDFMNSIGEADDKMGILQKASQYLRTFKDHRRLAHELHDIKTQVMEASERRNRYMLDQCLSVTTPVVVDPRVSALYKESASLVGIEDQKDVLINWVMEEEGKQSKFMAIVGLGGLGKTTLANEVYRDVGEKFECKAFISVSQKPQMIGIFNSLLSQLSLPTYSHACQLQDPINALRSHLQDKRYFIIVDDLWDTQAWDVIQCAFPQSNHCSRAIITTRNESVARSCCHNDGFIHYMKHLSEQDSRKLFFGRIFGSEDACPTKFKEVSCEILKKCSGLPLAIITMASMLACQPRGLEGQWKYIQNSLDIKSATNSKYEDMMYILDLSYKNLPRHLKACFLYLGSYPEDHQIIRQKLVRRWVAEGFVSNSGGQDVWDVAESYFSELVNRSMIQPLYHDYSVEVWACRVHDMLLDLIVRRCKEDNLLHLVNDPEAVAEVQDEVIRRLTFVHLGDTEDGMDVTRIITSRKVSQIRSLTVLKRSKWTLSLLESKFLRVLVLEDCVGIRIDQACMSQLSQLRYLKVGGEVEPPCQIRGLRSLETLDLSGIATSCNIELEIADVPRLCHLVLLWLHRTRLPDGVIGEVRLLRTLRWFVLPVGSLESIRGLGELTALSELAFYLSKGCVPLAKATWMAALSTSLEKLSNLRRLYIPPGVDRVVWHADALSSLSDPFSNLEDLDMTGFTFSRVPRWIGHLRNLRTLYLVVKQMLQEDAAIIGTRAPSLVRLALRVTDIPAERIVIRGSMGFPVVKCFEFDVYEWDKAAPGGLQHLPSLKKIVSRRSCYLTPVKWLERKGAGKTKDELIKGVFQEVIDALPTRPSPTFTLNDAWWIRPAEEVEVEEEEERLKVVD